MTQENRELLLKDLCARLLYGVEADCVGEYVKIKYIDPRRSAAYISNLGKTKWESIEVIIPYLRPMSSMIEDEFKELHELCPHAAYNKTNVPGWIVGISGSDYGRIARTDEIMVFIDWLNKNMFDYRGLIEKGLALEAPEEMYGKEAEK